MTNTYKFFLLLFIFLHQNSFANGSLFQYASKKLPLADLVIVRKSLRKMTLYQNGMEIKSYRVSLGGNPIGHKQKEGDSKTPEGKYILDWRNPNSSYYLSIHVSYPNREDKIKANKNKVSPGGDIMIHGQPNWLSWIQYLGLGSDWTDGCIAVTNVEMDEIWQSVTNGTPITIYR